MAWILLYIAIVMFLILFNCACHEGEEEDE